VVITGFYTASNGGDHGILNGMVNALSSHFEDIEIKVIAHHNETTSELTGLKSYQPLTDSERLTLLPVSILQACYLTIWALFYSTGISLPLWSNKKTVKAIADADLVLISGGGFLNDNYKPAIFGRLYEIFFAKSIGKPVGIYSHSLGPFNTLRYRTLAKIAFGRLDIITVREGISADLLNKMKISVPVHIVPDSAFALQFSEISKKKIPKHLKEYKGKMVSISVRKWHLYNTEFGHRRYIDALSKVGDLLVKRGYEVVFCSTCSGFRGYAMDDGKTAREILSKMKYKDQVQIIDSHMDPETLIHIYSKMTFHIGTRMHSNIYSLLAGTPVVPIAYEHKTFGIMRMLELEDLVVDINDVSVEKIMTKVEYLLNNYETLKERINENVMVTRKEAFRTPLLFDEFLKSNKNRI
jgi:colanic acid/amylovoran biosynthesis protein